MGLQGILVGLVEDIGQEGVQAHVQGAWRLAQEKRLVRQQARQGVQHPRPRSGTTAYTALRESNSETQLLAAPLAVAMAINASFIFGLAFVPGLW